MDGILREFEKLEKKQINKPLISSVDRITALLEETKRKIQNGMDHERGEPANERSSEYSVPYGVLEGQILL
jgi:hypothetical protein